MKEERSTPEFISGVRPHTVTRRRALQVLMTAGLTSIALPHVAGAVTQSEIDEAAQNVDKLQSTLTALGEEYEAAVKVLNETTDKIEQVNNDINTTQSQIDQKESEIAAKQAEIEAKREVLGKRMSQAYKSGPTGPLDVLFSSGSFEELVNNIYYLDRITQSEQDMINEIDSLKAELISQQNQLKEQQTQLVAQKNELTSLKSTQTEQVAAAQAKQDETTKLLKEASANLQNLKDTKAAEELAALQAANSNYASGSDSSTGGGSPASGVITGNGSLSAVLSAAYSTGSRGAGYCAGYVTDVFRNAGVATGYGNANDMYWAWCSSSDRSQLQPGMIIAVPTSPWNIWSQIYGHIGIYIGNGVVRENATGPITEQSVDSWIATNGRTSTPRWGWFCGVALS